MPRNYNTILLITRHRLTRVDVTRGSKPTLAGHWRQPRPDLPDLPSLAEATLLLGPRPGRKVWVLTTDLWTQTLDLPVQKTVGAGAAEVAAALNFEAEGHSGLSAFEALVANVPLEQREGLQHFWITQARAEDVAQIDEIVRRAGATLAGVLHPGGLPRPLVNGLHPFQPWQRIELWPDAVVGLAVTPAEQMDVRVFNTDPGLGRWRDQASIWTNERDTPEHREILAADLTAPKLLPGEHLVPLDQEPELASWMIAAAQCLSEKRPRWPVIRALPVPLSPGKRWGVSLVLALLVTAIVLGWHRWLTTRLAADNAELVKLQEPVKRKAGTEKQIKELEEKRVAVAAETAQLQRITTRVGLQRERLARLLRSLSQLRQPDLMVKKIDADAGDPKIHGVCLTPELADDFARALDEKLRPSGWEVEPPKKEAQNNVVGGAPWAFEIKLKTPVDPADSKLVISNRPGEHGQGVVIRSTRAGR